MGNQNLGWVTLTIIVAVMIAIEFVVFKLYLNANEDADIPTLCLMTRITSSVFIGAYVLWHALKQDADLKTFNLKAWGYMSIVGALSSAALLCFYTAVSKTKNPSYPAAVKELSIVFIVLLSSVFLGQSLKDIKPLTWLGFGLLGGGVTLVALTCGA